VRTFTRLPERSLAFLRDRESGVFLGISLLVGVAVGVGAALLIGALEAVGLMFEWVDQRFLDGADWYVVLSVPIGVTIAWWLARRFAPEAAGDGVPEVSAALAVHAGYLSTKSIPIKILATAFTLGGGGSAGREGPIVQVGGAIGSSISRRFNLGEDMVRSLVAAGAAAAIGASFNAPIAGMLFGLEVILGSFAVRHMSSVVLASIAAAVTLRVLVPAEEILQAASYGLGDTRELLLYAGLAILAVVAAWLFLRLLDVVERFSDRNARPAWLRPVGLGLAVGLLGLLEPRVLGTGQDFVTSLLSAQEFGERFQVDAYAWEVLIALALMKIVATGMTAATGGSGGAFMPSLFIGATLGAGYAQLVAPFWDFSDLRPGAFAVVGMATVFAAVARAPLTSIIIVFEVTGASDYGLIVPLMLSATFATFVADKVHPASVYTMPLERRGIRLTRASEVDLLDTIAVGDVMNTETTWARADMTLAEADQLMHSQRHHGLPVVGSRGLVGVVTVTDILRASEEPERLRVSDVMTPRPVTVSPATPVSEALERMAVLGVGRLPVVSDDDATQLVGVFRREEAVRAYHQALGTSKGTHLDRERFRQRTDPGAHYYDFRIPPGSVADGKAVRSVGWPEGSTLVSVRRGTNVLVPAGDTVLAAGDVVTAFGTDASRRRMIDRLNAGADEPTAEIEVVRPDDDQR
jgi:CIC family chloride channel protein